MTDYPEHEKLLSNAGDTRRIHEFLEWLTSQGISICGHSHILGWEPLGEMSVTNIVDEFFGVDTSKLKEEAELLAEEHRLRTLGRRP